MNMKNSIDSKRIGVLMGGPSRERDVSVRSGTAVCNALENNGIKPIPLELIKDSALNSYKKQVTEFIRSSRIEIAFIALHGEFGEDGGIQDILEKLNIPYTGSGTEASIAGMDKVRSKAIFESNNIPTPRYWVIGKKEKGSARISSLINEFGMPLVIKPSNEGSSIGLSIVESEAEIDKALDLALEHGGNAIVEEYIKGREITVGILDNAALPIVEIIPGRRFFDFEAKYKKGMTEYKVPAGIVPEIYAACQKIGLDAHKALGAHFFSRVDMIIGKNDKPSVLEVNTIPGLTETSLLPKAAYAAGINFDQLVLKILESALW
jgi:D-alanine-D-alanine ligase